MKETNSRAFRRVVKSVNQGYGFLSERGYEVISVEDFDLGWQTVLRKGDVFARIIRSRGEEEIYFRAGTRSHEEFTDSGSVIYAATGDKIPRWKSSDPKLVQQYLDRIEAYFEGEFARNPDSLRAAEAEYEAAFYRADVVTPEPELELEPKPVTIPLLHYPLLAMVLLLLFGALTTVYMAVLDRLFSAFALEPDSYGTFMGVTALVLAAGTLFLFRMRRKKG